MGDDLSGKCDAIVRAEEWLHELFRSGRRLRHAG